jgi:energy-coupling factor transport system ATP-binding protein
LSAKSLIDITNLTYTYPSGVTALKNLNLKINQGEFVAIIGPNGAGKTTLCLHLNGIIPVGLGGEMRGKVEVDGKDTVNHAVFELAQSVGLVLQDPEAQLLSPTVRKEVAFAAENFAMDPEEIKKRMNWALGIVRLNGIEMRPLPELSGGQKQRVAIAAALTLQPKILVLDEPTSQLDPLGTEEVFQVVHELNEKHGITIVMVEQKSEYVAEYAHRVVVLDKGEKLADGTATEVFSQVEMLQKLNIKIPEVTELGNTLKKKNILKSVPVTLDGSVQMLSHALDTKAVKVHEVTWERNAALENGGDLAVNVENLTYAYPSGLVALKNMNLKIKKGEFVAIIGQNGAGKTTFVKNLIGLLKTKDKKQKKINAGSITVLGQDVSKTNVAQVATKVGLVFQNPDYQIFRQSVDEEISFGPMNLNIPKEEVEKRVTNALKAVGLEKFRKTYPFSLSMGDRRRLTVAAVLAMGPEVLILDEPTTGQDYAGRYEIAELGKQLNQNGKTIIMITHDMELVAKYATRTIVFGKGEILLDDLTHNVFAKPEVLASTYLKPTQITMLAQRLDKYGLNRGILTLEDMYRNLGVSA